MIGPEQKKLYPNENIKIVCYICNLPKRPMLKLVNIPITVITKSFWRNIEHHYEFLGNKLIIGRFCTIAEALSLL